MGQCTLTTGVQEFYKTSTLTHCTHSIISFLSSLAPSAETRQRNRERERERERERDFSSKHESKNKSERQHSFLSLTLDSVLLLAHSSSQVSITASTNFDSVPLVQLNSSRLKSDSSQQVNCTGTVKVRYDFTFLSILILVSKEMTGASFLQRAANYYSPGK